MTLRNASLPKVGAVGLVLLLGACASLPPPTEQMAVSKAAVDNAVASGASGAAPEEMRSAIEELDKANAALATHDYKRARQYAEEAEVDAKLAQAKQQEVQAQKSVAELQNSIRALQDEIARQAH